MHLTPREQERLMLHYAGELARVRKEKGLKLNYPEAIAYISAQLLEKAREEKRNRTDAARYKAADSRRCNGWGSGNDR